METLLASLRSPSGHRASGDLPVCGGSAVVILHTRPVLPYHVLELPAACAGNAEREARKAKSRELSPGAGVGPREA